MIDSSPADPRNSAGHRLPPHERILRALDAGAIAGTWFWDVREDRFTADARFARSFGLDPQALEAGVTLAEVVQSIHPEDEQRVQRLVARALSIGGAYRAEYRVLQADGRYHWVEAKGMVELDGERRPLTFPGVLVDIDERKLAELRQDALLTLGNHLRSMRSRDGVTDLAARTCGQALGATRAGYAVVDAAAENVVVAPDWRGDQVTPSIAGRYRFADFGSFIDDLRQGHAVAIADVTADRRTAPHAKAFEPLRIRSLLNVPLMSEGRLAAVFLAHQDQPREWTEDEIDFVRGVADRAWAAIATAEVVEKLHEVNTSLEREVERRTADRNRLWRLSGDMMLVAGFDGRIAAVNPAWSAILGRSEEELVGANLLDFVHPDDRERTKEGARAMALGASYTAFDNRYLHKNGSTRWISWSATPGDGAIIAAGRDVTESREQGAALLASEEALRQSQKLDAIGQLTGGVAHDFNNVLAVIKNSIDLLRRVKPDDERRHRFMDSISNAVARAAKLTGQLLAFARRQSLQPAVFDVSANARAVAEMIEPLAGPGVAVEVRLACPECFVRADPSQFDTALVNLCVNARDAMKGSGALAIHVEAVHGVPAGMSQPAIPGDFVAVTISDTGSGIAQENLEKIFEPFFTTKGVGHGTGLGLSQVIGFARQSGGDIRVRSVVGQGSSFILYLPRVERPGDEAARPYGDAHAHAFGLGHCVLAVEDHEELARAVEDSLGELGFEVVMAKDAAGALALLREAPDRFSAVFSDVVMAGMSGVEMAEEMVRLGMETPVLLTSGYSLALAEAPEHGFAVLPKPYALEDLARELRRAIRRGAAASPGSMAAERARLAELDALRIMDTAEEAAYDELTQMAAEFCEAPIALISLVDDKRQWFKSKVGLQASETPREYAFCAHAIERPGETLVVEDTTRDGRFAGNPLVTGDPNIRFYAGAPLVTSGGQAVGTLCVIDTTPRSLDARQLEVLRLLANQVVARLEARRAALDLS